MAEDFDLVRKLSPDDLNISRFRLSSVSPDEGKYASSTDALRPYLSAEAEWRKCAEVQLALIETRAEFEQAKRKNVEEVREALKKINPLNMSLLEAKVTKHDQLAVIEEIGRFVSLETKALLHPGTTSYDILDTARAVLFKQAWKNVIRPEASKAIIKLCELAERSIDILQVGRTHLQDTSPVLFGGTLAGYAGRMAERTARCDSYFKALKGKASGIVGTGAGIEMVVGEGKSIMFEKAFLNKLKLKPDYTATQVVQKESLADVGHGIVTFAHVLGDFTNDMRMLYSSAIGEVTSRDNAERLGGSSADAMKNNPIDFENMTGKVDVIESGMRVLYGMIATDFQRDLRGSVKGRYQPHAMMAQFYESLKRLNKSLGQLSINEDRILQNLQGYRDNPSEAMVAILRGAQWIHPIYGEGHNFVKEIGKESKSTKRKLLEVAQEDTPFMELYETLSPLKQEILQGHIEKYTGSAKKRAFINIEYANSIAASNLQQQ
ncbi:MAG: lyase family protein [Nanoarchaeota archaeon]|nr:lyase family protein [Nanoarchaeota archaeon]